MRNELQRHKRSDKVKWVLTGIMFFLAFVMIAGLALQVFGTGKTKPSEWFKKQDSEQTEQLPAEGDENATAHMSVKAMSAEAIVSDSTITPPCEHMTDTIGDFPWGYDSSHLSSPLTISKPIGNGRNVSFKNRTSGETLFDHCGRSPYYAEYAAAGRSEYYVTAIWCLHGFVGNCVRIYGHSFTNVELDLEGALSSSDPFFLNRELWNTCTVETHETIDMDTGTVTIRLDAKFPLSSIEGDYPSVYDDRMPFTFLVDKVLPLPDDPVKEGYTFTGWYTDEACTVPYEGTTVTEDTTLYAGWQAHVHTLTLNANGGELTETSVSGDYGTVPTIPTPERTGYNFMGWKTADGQTYDVTAPYSQDLTLTAQWEIKTFTVTFYVDGEVYVMKTVEYGQRLKKVAETANLRMLFVRVVSGMPATDESGAIIVTEDCSVEAQKMSDTDKAINTVKNHKWSIIGGVAGGIALIAVIAAVCGGVKRKRRR